MAITYASKPAAVVHASPNTLSPNKAGNWSRNAKWRSAHPEAYRSYMREYMKKRRAGS